MIVQWQFGEQRDSDGWWHFKEINIPDGKPEDSGFELVTDSVGALQIWRRTAAPNFLVGYMLSADVPLWVTVTDPPSLLDFLARYAAIL